MSIIVVFSMLSFGHILISDHVVADLFMHLFPGMVVRTSLAIDCVFFALEVFCMRLFYIAYCWPVSLAMDLYLFNNYVVDCKNAKIICKILYCLCLFCYMVNYVIVILVQDYKGMCMVML